MTALTDLPPEHGVLRPPLVHRQVGRLDRWGRLRNRFSLAQAVMQAEATVEPESPRVAWAAAVLRASPDDLVDSEQQLA